MQETVLNSKIDIWTWAEQVSFSVAYMSQFEKEMECEHTRTHPHIEWGEEEFTVYFTQPLVFQMFNYCF